MSAFNWLLLGHLVGDWLLQNDWMAKGKTKSLYALPGFIHYIVYTVTVLVFFILSTSTTVSVRHIAITTSIVFVSHWLIDGGNLARRWMQCFGQDDQVMVRVVIDQTFHLLILGVLATFYSHGNGAI